MCPSLLHGQTKATSDMSNRGMKKAGFTPSSEHNAKLDNDKNDPDYFTIIKLYFIQ